MISDEEVNDQDQKPTYTQRHEQQIIEAPFFLGMLE